MRPWGLTILFTVIVISVGATLVADDALPGWFDYVHCDFCKQYAAQPGLIGHFHEEARNISDGIIWITYIDKEYREKYRLAMLGQEMVMRGLLPGKSPKVCQYCNTVGQFGAKGIRLEAVSGSEVEVTIYTSTDTSLVRQLHKFGAKAAAEEAKATAAFLAGKPTEGTEQ